MDLACLQDCKHEEANKDTSTTSTTTTNSLNNITVVVLNKAESSSWEIITYILTSIVAVATLVTLRKRMLKEMRSLKAWICECDLNCFDSI